jgi:hypothetical protein
MNPKHSLKVFMVAALGAIAMLALPAMAAAKDRNHDRIPDRWEKRHNLSLHVNQARRDQDRDHLRNRAEFMASDNPRSSDSDSDGIPDGEENAGTIQSFDPSTGKLTIALFGGETLSGLVSEETEIECEGDHHGIASASDDGQEHGSPAGEEGEGEPGDDHGDHGEEGEDHQGEGGEPGDDDGPGGEPGDEDGPGDGEAPSCTTADLTEGATVREAELKLESGSASFEKVELAG